MSRYFHPPSLLIAIAFAIVSFSVWAYLNQPQTEPDWPTTIQGFAFSPFHADENAITGKFPTPEEISADLALLSGKTHAIRTYSVEDVLGKIPTLAAKHNINVTLGAWIDTRKEFSEKQVEKAIRIAWHHTNVVRVIIGNEVILRGKVPKERLFGYLDRAREALYQPVSTAEPWDVWVQNPELAEHVDFIAIHLLPYWEGIGVERAVDYAIDRYEAVQQTFPDKPIVIAEVGWPSRGRTRESAVASPSNEALFLRRFLAEAEERGYVYYVMEAFDQPWKAENEGSVGAYWGVYDVNRQPKFAFDAPIVRIPHWQILAAVSIIIATIMLAAMLTDSRTLNKSGRSFLAIVANASAAVAVWVVYDYSQQYWTLQSVIVGLVMFASMLGVFAVLFAEAHEWVEARWAHRRRREFLPRVTVRDEDLPLVSIHVPAYNEPPDMLIETLDALAALDYPRFEVIVMDNNTPEKDTWAPVAAHCKALNEQCAYAQFKFYHEGNLTGFKAGALNYALEKTDSAAGMVAVIDSDYQVRSDWLRNLIPLFKQQSAMGIVQAPQDYRDGDESLFKAMCFAEYRGFFYIGMITRNERNAIIQHGTMTIIRRDVLQAVGAWAPWCITEDAELGLRIFEHGWQSAYLPASYGRGLMPDTFVDYKKQRARWAFGSMQILRRHFKALFGFRKTELNAGQSYHFLAGWLPWLADGFNLLFNLAALGWSFAMIAWPQTVDPPLVMFSILPLCLFAFKIAKLLHLYLTRVGAGWRQTVGAALAGLALTHAIGVAMLSGLVRRSKPFVRTPKQAPRHAWLAALFEAREETLLASALLLCAWGVAHSHNMELLDVLVWVSVLLMQCIPYTASWLLSLISGLRLPASVLGKTQTMRSSEQHIHAKDRAEQTS